MSRGYPRFLFSNPQNTKSPGPFVVHTLEPEFIAKITMVPCYERSEQSVHNGKYVLHFLKPVKFSTKLDAATEALYKWLDNNDEVKEWIKK